MLQHGRRETMRKGGCVPLLLAAAACEPGNPCDEYVSYMCDCHPELSCESFTTTYEDPDPSVQDECAVSLAEQEQEDSDAGVECGTAPETTPEEPV
jgi:hypothetical protein